MNTDSFHSYNTLIQNRIWYIYIRYIRCETWCISSFRFPETVAGRDKLSCNNAALFIFPEKYFNFFILIFKYLRMLMIEFWEELFPYRFKSWALGEEVLLCLHSSSSTLLAWSLLFWQPCFLVPACFYGQAVSTQAAFTRERLRLRTVCVFKKVFRSHAFDSFNVSVHTRPLDPLETL